MCCLEAGEPGGGWVCRCGLGGCIAGKPAGLEPSWGGFRPSVPSDIGRISEDQWILLGRSPCSAAPCGAGFGGRSLFRCQGHHPHHRSFVLRAIRVVETSEYFWMYLLDIITRVLVFKYNSTYSGLTANNQTSRVGGPVVVSSR